MMKRGIMLSFAVLALTLSFVLNGLPFASGEEYGTRSDGAGDTRWLQFRGNLNNTGYSASSVPATGRTFLEFPTLRPIQSSPVYANGVVYFGNQNAKVYAVVAATGKELWNFTAGNFFDVVDSTPAIHEDILFVGSSDNKLYALNVTTGKEVWNYTTGDDVVSSPKYHEGIVYFGSKDGYLYAINATTGLDHWAPFATGDPIWGTPAIAESRIFIGSNDENFYSIWLENGTKDWNYSIPQGSSIGVAFASATVYKGKVIVTSDNYYAYCLDIITGSEEWRFDSQYEIYSSPAVHNDSVFFASYDAVFAIPFEDPNDDGVIDQSEILWEVPSPNFEGGSSPAVAEGRVLVASTSFGLMCLNETDGSYFWNMSIPGGTVSSPAVIDGKVFIGGTNGIMYGIGSSGLPSLEVQIVPVSDTLIANRVMTIAFLVTHDQEPVEGAFVTLSITSGALSQKGASTFSDGTNKVKYTAPTVEENTTVTISAVAEKYGFEDGITSYEIVIEPATQYGDVAADTGFDYVKYSPYFVVIGVFGVLVLVLIVLIVRLPKKEKEGEVDTV